MATEIIKNLPVFRPAYHKELAVNVIIDIPLQLKPDPDSNSEAKEINHPKESTVASFNPKETPAIAAKCEKAKDVKGCTAKFVQEFLFKNFDTYNFSTKVKLQQTIVHFTITEEGKITNFTAEGDHKRLNKEGIQALRSLPDFIPATKDGKNVSTTFSMPIRIKSSK